MGAAIWHDVVARLRRQTVLCGLDLPLVLHGYGSMRKLHHSENIRRPLWDHPWFFIVLKKYEAYQHDVIVVRLPRDIITLNDEEKGHDIVGRKRGENASMPLPDRPEMHHTSPP